MLFVVLQTFLGTGKAGGVRPEGRLSRCEMFLNTGLTVRPVSAAAAPSHFPSTARAGEFRTA